MNPSSPWYLFDPTSPGWIIRRHKRGEYISAEDVARVVASYPDAVNDPLICGYIERAARGELRKPAGRPAKGIIHYLRLFLARDLVEEKVAAWREARRNGSATAPPKGRGNPSLSELAYDEVASEMRFNISGRSLANAISRTR